MQLSYTSSSPVSRHPSLCTAGLGTQRLPWLLGGPQLSALRSSRATDPYLPRSVTPLLFPSVGSSVRTSPQYTKCCQPLLPLNPNSPKPPPSILCSERGGGRGSYLLLQCVLKNSVEAFPRAAFFFPSLLCLFFLFICVSRDSSTHPSHAENKQGLCFQHKVKS